MDSKVNNRGQATVFAIVAIVLVVVFIVITLFIQKDTITTNSEEPDPRSFISQCTRQAVGEVESIILEKGGFVNPGNFILYQSKNIEYLCENRGFFETCITQHPLLLNDIKNEITTFITPKIEQCYQDFKEDLEQRNFNVNLGNLQVGTKLGPKRIYIGLDNPLTIEKTGETRSFNSLNFEIQSPLYDLALVALEIANQEANFCYFEYIGYTALHPEFDIRVFTTSDSTRIYTIKDVESNQELNIATRSCAIPQGI